VATVRYETAPGAQLQIDFGQKLVSIAGTLVRAYLLVAVLSYSRGLFVKSFLAERQDDWRGHRRRVPPLRRFASDVERRHAGGGSELEAQGRQKFRASDTIVANG
jgi:transposase